MTTVLISPGVFTREFDGTVRPAAVEGATPVIIGPRAKGPAMEPVQLKDVDEDEKMFGLPSRTGRDFAAYASRLFLKQETSPETFVRVLGMSDTGVDPGYTIGRLYAIAASGSRVVALIHSSGAVAFEGTLTSSVDRLAINIAGHGSFTASLNRNDTNYIKKVLNTDPSQYDTKKHYVFAVYDYAEKNPIAGGAYSVQLIGGGANWQDEFITGSTTTIISQPFDTTEYDLFGLGNRFAGDSANEEIKVSIRDIKKSPNEAQYEYGTFTVVVRKFDDNDKSPLVLESFPNCNLDPESPNYVARRIGTKYKVWNKTRKKFDEFGDYENKSKYIYVVPSTDLVNGNVPATALPFGFSAYRKLTNASVGSVASFPDIPFVGNLLYKGSFNTRVHWGAAIIDNASGSINHGIVDKLKHVSTALMAVSGTTGDKFSLKWISGAVGNVSGFSHTSRLTTANLSALSTSIQYNTGSTNPSVSGSGGFTGYLSVANIENTDLAKFTVPMHDGFDGVNVHLSDPFNPSDMSTTTAYQTLAYRMAVDMVSNPDEHDLTEVALPGVHASLVTDYALDMVEDRGDTFYLMDVSGSTVDDVVSQVQTKQLDSNYAAVYYPWVKLNDDVNNKQVYVPPTTVLPAVYANSDKVGFVWYAPAGMNRGGLAQFGVLEAKDKIKASERDTLYDNRINPIATFKRAVVVWGQKTLQIQDSALTRINVRRMLLKVRKQIARTALEVVFEPNVAKTWDTFVNKINPYLEKVRENSGVADFKVILDERTTTEDLIERNVMYGKIAIKPTRTAEYILLDFFVTNNTAGFEE